MLLLRDGWSPEDIYTFCLDPHHTVGSRNRLLQVNSEPERDEFDARVARFNSSINGGSWLEQRSRYFNDAYIFKLTINPTINPPPIN